MKSDRHRFLAALALYALWIAGLATMAATSAARPVNLQDHAVEAGAPPTPAGSNP
jgi:hypothetical protein